MPPIKNIKPKVIKKETIKLSLESIKKQITQDKHHIFMEESFQSLKLREKMAKRLFIILIAELVIVHIVILMQGFHLWEFKLMATTIDVFIGATVVQIAAMITIIVRSLFPPGR